MSRTKITEVVASSTGNHGAAVAYAAKTHGLPARIFLPKNPNQVKHSRIADLEAEIVEDGSADLCEAFQLASAYANKEGIYFLNDATDPDLPAGPVTTQAEKAPSYYLSWKNGHAITTATCNTMADGLATRIPDEGNVR